MKKIIIIFFVSIFFVAFIVGKCKNDDSIDTTQSAVLTTVIDETVNTKIPQITTSVDSSVAEIPSMSNNIRSQMLYRKAYCTSYNKETKCPNWVAWHLTNEHTDGPFSRKGVPYYDEDGTAIGIGTVTPETQRGDYFLDMESEEPRQLLSDWPNNEYSMSHGHMCPAGDNKWDKAAMNQSFLLTNMCPQDEKLNGGGWKKLEEKCRTWASLYGDIYIVAGPIYKSGKVSRTIGKSKIAVPDAFFKVILCMKGTPKAIGFIYKNDSSSQAMKDCACSVDEVEELTGFDFFSSLDNETEGEVESVFEFKMWQ